MIVLYASPAIRDVLIADGLRTWSDVELTVSLHEVTSGFGCWIYDQSGKLLNPAFDHIHAYCFTFPDESAAMAFRLRYSDYLVDRPRHPDCDALMALEVV